MKEQCPWDVFHSAIDCRTPFDTLEAELHTDCGVNRQWLYNQAVLPLQH